MTVEIPETMPDPDGICLEVAALRHLFLSQRVQLPKPGYHLDLDPARAEESVRFLKCVPGLCDEVIRRIRAFHSETEKEDFIPVLARLESLRGQPSLVFSLAGREIYADLAASDELLSVLQKNMQTLARPEGGPDVGNH